MRRLGNTAVRIWQGALTRWVLLMAVCLLLGMNGYHISFFPPGSIDPSRVGDLGEWFAGVATAGAVIVAASSLRRDRTEAQLAQSRRDREVTGDVYSWVEFRQLRPGRKSLILLVVNRTANPIYDWEVTLVGARHQLIGHVTHGPLLPEARFIELDDEDLVYRPGVIPVKTTVSFTSALGKRLKRDSSGLLMEVEP
jgi:hypothetical protein